MFTSSSHNIKSKISKKKHSNNNNKEIELWKMMKGICFTFDAFVMWGEHDRSKMKWRTKVRVEWRQSMAGRPHSPSFLPFPSTIYLFSSATTPLGQSRGQRPHGLATRPPYLASQEPLGSPIKGLPRGAFSFIPQAHEQHQIF
jgi:hypothetical protein